MSTSGYAWRMVWFLFAHGAGAGSSSAWTRRWAGLLAEIGPTETFDYPYQRAGRKRPDVHAVLTSAHVAALEAGLRTHGSEVVLVGKSMGGRIGCHVALKESVLGNVCLGYPLVSPSGKGPLRDQVLLELERPVCFVQGTRDALCPLDRLQTVISQRRAASILHVVPSGDHSLTATKSYLKQAQTTQDALERDALEVIERFCSSLPRPAASGS